MVRGSSERRYDNLVCIDRTGNEGQKGIVDCTQDRSKSNFTLG